MWRVAVREARDQFADLINRVIYGGERVVIERRGKDAVAIVSLQDLELLEQIEDRIDLEEAKRALEESDERIPYEQIRAELGL